MYWASICSSRRRRIPTTVCVILSNNPSKYLVEWCQWQNLRLLILSTSFFTLTLSSSYRRFLSRHWRFSYTKPKLFPFTCRLILLGSLLCLPHLLLLRNFSHKASSSSTIRLAKNSWWKSLVESLRNPKFNKSKTT